jgi:hypothetical protein
MEDGAYLEMCHTMKDMYTKQEVLDKYNTYCVKILIPTFEKNMDSKSIADYNIKLISKNNNSSYEKKKKKS